jgi:deoxyribodipyrimidine photo-lyase
MVDAECQTIETGYMHNRVRGLRGFLCKTFIDKLAVGRNLFAENYWIMKWHPMWAMAMGGWYRFDAAYFRVFNPEIQLKKFDEREFTFGMDSNLNWVTEAWWIMLS